MRKVTAYYSALAALCLLNGAIRAQTRSSITEITGFSHPESVYQEGNTLFVSNIGPSLDPQKKDGDGYISKVDLRTGKITALHFLPALEDKDTSDLLDAPKGMAMLGHILYIADIDHIVGFDIQSGKKVFNLLIEGTGFLNDLVACDGKIYASATDNGKIYEIDPGQPAYHAIPVADSITGANGLYYHAASRTLYCVGVGTWGKWDGGVFAIDLVKTKIRKITDYKGLLDGVDRAGDILYFSDWRGMEKKGGLLALNLRTAELREVRLPGGNIGGPADFMISRDKKYFIIPATLEGKVLIEKIEVRRSS